MTMAENLADIRKSFAGKPVTLIAVSKYVGIEQIEEAFKNGVTEFGESKIQDALLKQNSVPPHMAEHIHWHFIGHLQSNKAKKAVGRFVLIHSVDSFSLAKELSAQAVKMQTEQSVLLQVKIVDDPSKSGFGSDELKDCFRKILDLPGLRVDGLMTMTPLTEDEEVWKTCFIGLKSLRDELEKQHGVRLKELSMGMSDDYEVAVTCGATMVRVGTAIFENSQK